MKAGACAQRSQTSRYGRIRTALPLALMLLLSTPALADDFVSPVISFSRVDWRAAIDQIRFETSARPDAASSLTFSRARRHRPFDQRRAPVLMQLNAIMASVFPGVDQSSVPVLLPFDTPGYLADRMADVAPSLVYSRYLSGFRNVDFFDAGASGYDAIVTAAAGGNADLPSRVFARPVEIHITGSLLTYGIADPLLGKGEPGEVAERPVSGHAPHHS